MELDVYVMKLMQQSSINILQLMTISFMRPIGLLFGFIGIVRALGGTSSIIRTGIGFALALPVLVIEGEKLLQFIEQAPLFKMFVIYLKEFGIGMTLGLLASIPFWIVQFGGSLIDTYRGESSSGHQDPSGGEISTLGNYNVIVALLIFSSLGGLSYLIGEFYRTYQLWPITETIPISNNQSVEGILSILNYITFQALVVASPLLFLLFAIDFIVLVCGKVAKGFNGMDASYSVKNLLTLCVLPVLAVVYVHTLQSKYFKDMDLLSQLQRILQ